MKKLLLGAGVLAVAGLGYLFYEDTSAVKTTYSRPIATPPPAQAMIPWRSPAADRDAFFPGAPLPDAANPTVLSLSRQRQRILERLGPRAALSSNALYTFPLTGRGVVLLRRAAGEYGGIEVVVGCDLHGKVVGVRLQRHREPPEIAAVLESRAFLESFRGKTAQSPFSLPPNVPTVAVQSAQAVLDAVRALLIEYDAGTHP